MERQYQEVIVPDEVCEVCGEEPCRCPRPLGECDDCHCLIFDEADAYSDGEGGHYCYACISKRGEP